MHLALYRAERPERFEEIIGQRHIVKILRNQLAQGSVSQAYLFAGTRGTGKTTTARILAKAVNCVGTDDPAAVPCCECENCKAIRAGRFLDVVELDAASNNGVEDLRSIIDSVQYPPTIGKYKVYIIDEVHMLSQAAENAFLKTLEEPPEYAIFILATTDPEKVRQTIRSRCMTLNFRRVSEDDLVQGMRDITEKRGVAIDDDALRVVARRADGSVRDALSILEQCISGGDEHVTADMIYEYLGSAGLDYYLDLTEAVISGDTGGALTMIDTAVRQGKDAKQILSDWLGHYRDLMIVKYVDDPAEIVGSSEENTARLRSQAEKLRTADLQRAIKMLSEQVNTARYSGIPRLLLETSAIRLASPGFDTEPAQQQGVSSGLANGRSTGLRTAQALTGSPGSTPNATTHTTAQARPAATGAAEGPAAGKQALAAHSTETPISAPSETDATPVADYDEMWQRIAGQVAQSDRSFIPMVGNHSRITSFNNDEIVLVVKKNKVAMANTAKDAIERVARSMYGERTFVTIKPGDVEQVRITDLGVSTVTDTGQREDVPASVEDIASGISDLFGMDVTIK